MADDLIIRVNMDDASASASLNKLKGKAGEVGGELKGGFGKAVKALGPLKSALGAIAAIGTGAIIANQFKDAVKQLAAFNLKIAEVNTLLPQTNRVTGQTEKAIRNLSVQFGKDKGDLAAAYYDVISAGSTDAAKSLELLETATKASIVGVTDTRTATGAILSVMNAYGEETLNASQAATKLFTIVQKGRTTFPELAASIGDVVPLAANLGVSLDELGGALAVSTRVSGNTAKSVTQLTAAFTNILKPTESAKKTIKLLNSELGTSLEFSAQALKEKGLQQFLGEIFDASKQFKNQEQILSNLFGSVRAVRGVLSLTGENFKETKEAIKAVNEQTETLNEGFNIISSTLSAKFDKAVETSSGFITRFASLAEPALTSIVDKFTMIATAANVAFDVAMADKGKSASESLVLLKEGVDPLTASLDNMMFSMTGGEDAEMSPMAQFAVDTNQTANSMAAAGEVAEGARGNLKGLADQVEDNKDKNNKAKDSFDLLRDSMNRALGQGTAKAISTSIQIMTKSLITGEMNFKKFGQAIAGIIGDMAIQIGEMAIATGITMEALGKLTPGAAIAAGAGLIAIGTLIKSFAGKGGGASSSIASPVAPVGAESVGTIAPVEETLDETTTDPGSIEKEQRVQLIVQGDILDGESTSTRILELLNQELEFKNGRIITA